MTILFQQAQEAILNVQAIYSTSVVSRSPNILKSIQTFDSESLIHYFKITRPWD